MDTITNKSQILDLPIAVNEDGEILFHSLEWCKSENLVIVSEDGKDWVRGKNNLRYRAIPTGTLIKDAFPKLTSKRDK